IQRRARGRGARAARMETAGDRGAGGRAQAARGGALADRRPFRLVPADGRALFPIRNNFGVERPVTQLAHLQSGEIAPGVHGICSQYGDAKPLLVFVLDGDFALWVDAGINVTPGAHVIPYLKERAPALWRKNQVVLVTHADVDHFGGLGQLRRARPDLMVLAHAADQRWIESEELILRERYAMHEADGVGLPPARRQILRERGGGGGRVQLALRGGETIDLGAGGRWQVLTAPGHTAGHIVLWNEAARI